MISIDYTNWTLELVFSFIFAILTFYTHEIGHAIASHVCGFKFKKFDFSELKIAPTSTRVTGAIREKGNIPIYKTMIMYGFGSPLSIILGMVFLYIYHDFSPVNILSLGILFGCIIVEPITDFKIIKELYYLRATHYHIIINERTVTALELEKIGDMTKNVVEFTRKCS